MRAGINAGLAGLAGLLWFPLALAASQPVLPPHLTLHYVLHYGNVVVGKTIQSLQRNAGGVYRHSARTRPAGIAKLFTAVQFDEEGTFRVAGAEVLPVHFVDTRTGDGRDYRRYARFDYPHHRLVFQQGAKPLPPGTQDLDSIFYAFMLHPVRPGMRRLVYITNGKDVDPYWFVYRRSEMLVTPLGRVQTYLMSRLSKSEWLEEQHCGRAGSAACLRPLRVFEIWVAPALHDVAVKVRERKHGRTLGLSLVRLER